MSNALQALLALPAAEQERLGLAHTAAEIAGQADLWPATLERFRAVAGEIRPFLQGFLAEPRRSVICCGAGTSEYAGLCLAGLLRRRWGVPVTVASTTALVTRPEELFAPGHATLLLSFARSGESPESLGAVRIAEQVAGPVYHMVVTCNAAGALALETARLRRARVLTLDPRTNDAGLAMTASFTNMVIAGQMLAHVLGFEAYERIFPQIVAAGRAVLERAPDPIAELSRGVMDRGVFLGDGALYGCAVESRLKLQEMTAGRVMCAFDTFAGLRHGPEALLDQRTLVGAFLSEDPFARRIETDLLEEVRKKGLGRSILAVADRCGEASRHADFRVEYDPDGRLGVPADCSAPVHVIAGQLIALFRSLESGLKPDEPSESGVIHRVVEGVKVYDPAAFRSDGRFVVLAQR